MHPSPTTRIHRPRALTAQSCSRTSTSSRSWLGNRERIPARVVHAVGSGAGGHFEVTNDLSRYARAKVFSQVGTRTEVFVRFSTVAGSKGASSTSGERILSAAPRSQRRLTNCGGTRSPKRQNKGANRHSRS
ncbi:MAG TPA: catalase, partial [Acidimicrobiales bacterium]|nr:catalase [Acidimicrobiales bacterium]